MDGSTDCLCEGSETATLDPHTERRLEQLLTYHYSWERDVLLIRVWTYLQKSQFSAWNSDALSISFMLCVLGPCLFNSSSKVDPLVTQNSEENRGVRRGDNMMDLNLHH